MRVFVTGGSGFVGGHAIERIAREHEVFAMARSEASAAVVRGFGATPVRCELGAVRAEDLAGIDAIVHAAAFVEEWGTRDQFWTANVVGTTQLLDAARAAGVKRFVHVGTEAAVFDGHALVDVDERAPYPTRHRFLYSETKAEAEKRVLAARSDAFTTISVRPRLVWGPRDASVLPAVVRMAKAGRFAWLDGGRHLTSTTHASNLAEALALALGRGRSGEAYFVADDGTRTVREFLTPLAATAGVDLSRAGNVPGWLARPVSVVVEGAYRMVGATRTPPMTRFAIAMMSRTVTVNTAKAKAELGYAPKVSVEEGLRAMQAG